jgi:hypothetical protein
MHPSKRLRLHAAYQVRIRLIALNPQLPARVSAIPCSLSLSISRLTSSANLHASPCVLPVNQLALACMPNERYPAGT